MDNRQIDINKKCGKVRERLEDTFLSSTEGTFMKLVLSYEFTYFIFKRIYFHVILKNGLDRRTHIHTDAQQTM